MPASSSVWHQVKRLAPESHAARLERKKYPPPATTRFAKFSRKPTDKMVAVGGLCPELVVSQMVNTTIPAQYGNLMAMETSPIFPNVSPEISMTFKSLSVG